MSRLARTPRNSVNDRPGRLKLLLRRQKRHLSPTRLAGASAIAVVLGAVVVHSIDRNWSVAALRERFAVSVAPLGLRVSDIQIVGRANTPETALRAALGTAKGDPILGFSIEKARERIEKLSWVEHATVERRLPGTIVVALEERRPFAIWQNEGKFLLIDRAGQVVTNHNVAEFRHLPLVVGTGAPEAAATLLDALAARSQLASHVIAAVRVGQRRWNLAMRSGITVLLPEGHEVAALDRLIALDQAHKLLQRPLQLVDMRLPDCLVLRARPASAAPADAHGARQPDNKAT